jgi:hypothetical protein
LAPRNALVKLVSSVSRQLLREHFVSHVAGDRNGLASCLLDLVHQFVQLRSAARGHNQLCALARKQQRGCPADPRARAGDNSDFAGKCIHSIAPAVGLLN